MATESHWDELGASKKFLARVTGREARTLHQTLIRETEIRSALEREILKLKSTIESAGFTAHSQEPLSGQVPTRLWEMPRAERLHPYVREALSLLPGGGRLVTTTTAADEECSLGECFTNHGSDKATRHDYAHFYQEFLNGKPNPKILEIGLGSLRGFPYGGLNPGASLRAWREHYPHATVVGLDIDASAVEAVESPAFFMDQTSDESITESVNLLTPYGPFDLIVDDGFHDPHANVRSLVHLLPLCSSDGIYVIEDVHESLIDFWRIAALSIDARDFEIQDRRAARPECDDNVLVIVKP